MDPRQQDRPVPAAAVESARCFTALGARTIGDFEAAFREPLREVGKDVHVASAPLQRLISYAERVRAYEALQTSEAEAILRRCCALADMVLNCLELRYTKRQESIWRRMARPSGIAKLDREIYAAFKEFEHEGMLLRVHMDRITWCVIYASPGSNRMQRPIVVP
jgi:hypothetical protein